MLELVASLMGRREALKRVAPELRGWALLSPPMHSSGGARFMRRATKLAARMIRPPAGIRIGRRSIGSGDTPLEVLVVERDTASHDRPALLWLHGGGFVAGAPEMDIPLLARILEELDVLIVSVDYRLAPEHPFPAGLDDGLRAFRWMIGSAEELGIDPRRIAVGGASAGAGLAAALVQKLCDGHVPRPAFQLLIYPMLDDRTGEVRPDEEPLVWNSASNHFGWSAYLRSAFRSEDAPPYAVPARRKELAGLPPAWIGVGDIDLFFHEDVAYAARLNQAGVPCALEQVPGAPHGFDITSFEAQVTRDFHRKMIDALRSGLTAFPGELPLRQA